MDRLFLRRRGGGRRPALDDALQDPLLTMPPPVLSELLSDPKMSADLEATLRDDAAGLDLVVSGQ